MLPVCLQVLLQCPKLQTLLITGCSKLEVLMLWSEEITELDLTGQNSRPWLATDTASSRLL